MLVSDLARAPVSEVRRRKTSLQECHHENQRVGKPAHGMENRNGRDQVIRPAAYAAAGFLFGSVGRHTIYAAAAVIATAASLNFIAAVQSESPGTDEVAAKS